MLPGPTYEQIIESLTWYLRDDKDSVKLVGLIFARPEAPLAKDQIFPSVPYFHYSSGRTNFYFAGFGQGEEVPVGGIAIQDPKGGPDWIFSPKAFNDLKKDIQSRTKWRYSGGSDLVLTNVSYSQSTLRAEPDFATAISVNLNDMKRDGAFEDVSMLFEQIFRFSEEANEHDRTWGFSDRMGVGLGKSALKEILISLLPKGLRSKARKAFYYVTEDLRPETVQ